MIQKEINLIKLSKVNVNNSNKIKYNLNLKFFYSFKKLKFICNKYIYFKNISNLKIIFNTILLHFFSFNNIKSF